jgi:hypothetical protein
MLYIYIFYHLQSTSHITARYMSLNIVVSRGWLRTVGETCSSAFVIRTLVQLVGSTLLHVSVGSTLIHVSVGSTLFHVSVGSTRFHVCQLVVHFFMCVSW